MSDLKSVNLAQKLTLFSDTWHPRVVGQFNGHDLMLVKVEGAFAWQSHPETDDFFYVVRGVLDLEMWTETVTLRQGEMFVVPQGVDHRPVARPTADLLVIAPAGAPDTVTAAPRDWV